MCSSDNVILTIFFNICTENTLLAVNNFCPNGTDTVCYAPNEHQLTETTGYILYVLYQIIGSIILMRMLTSLMTETLKALRVGPLKQNHHTVYYVKIPSVDSSLKYPI